MTRLFPQDHAARLKKTLGEELLVWLSAKKGRFREGVPTAVESPDFARVNPFRTCSLEAADQSGRRAFSVRGPRSFACIVHSDLASESIAFWQKRLTQNCLTCEGTSTVGHDLLLFALAQSSMRLRASPGPLTSMTLYFLPVSSW